MKAEEVFEIARTIAKGTKFDPLLVTAVCQQESSFDHHAVRLEQGFYRRYVEKMELASTSEVLLSASYGLMQVMGLTLLELGYFKWFLAWNNEQPGAVELTESDSQMTVVKGIDEFMKRPDWQVLWGVRTLEAKSKMTTGVHQTLLAYNGGGNLHYPDEVLSKLNQLQTTLS